MKRIGCGINESKLTQLLTDNFLSNARQSASATVKIQNGAKSVESTAGFKVVSDITDGPLHQLSFAQTAMQKPLNITTRIIPFGGQLSHFVRFAMAKDIM